MRPVRVCRYNCHEPPREQFHAITLWHLHGWYLIILVAVYFDFYNIDEMYDWVVLLLKVPYVPEGLEAIIFTADGDMRQALNNLQATYSGFQFVNQANVFKVRINYDLYFPQFFVGFVEIYGWFQVCDQPHPLHVKNMVRNVIEGNFDDACSGLKQLYDLGYSPTDIITTLFRIIKNYDMAEYLKLEFMKVANNLFAFTHTRA